MDLATAQDTIADWFNNTFFWSDELGADVAASNESILSEAIGNVASVTDFEAFLADVESQITLYDPDAEPFDNSGATVVLDDGTEMSYDDYAAAGLENSGVEDPFAGMTPIFTMIDPLAERRPSIGIAEMSHLDV